MNTRFARLATRAQAKGYIDYKTEDFGSPEFELIEHEIFRVVEEDITVPAMTMWGLYYAIRTKDEDGEDPLFGVAVDIGKMLLPWVEVGSTGESDDYLFDLYEQELGEENE